MKKTILVIPCDICLRVPALYVARCGLLLCRACWQQETRTCEEARDADHPL